MARPGFALAFLVMMLAGAPALGQVEPDRYLPRAAAFGGGWEELSRGSIEVNEEAFRDGAYATYGGPAGTRIAIEAYILKDPSAIRRSWELATATFERYAREYATDWFRPGDDFAGIAPPDGCDDAKRSYTAADQFRVPLTVALCAVGIDAILIVIASGEIDGERGHRTADAVIEAVLALAEQATPTA